MSRIVLLAPLWLAGCCLCGHRPDAGPPHTLVVVVPGADGHVGAVMVNPGPGQLVLDSAYAGARVTQDAAPEPARLSAREVERRFAAARQARPPPPRHFELHFVSGTSDLDAASSEAMGELLREARGRPGADIRVVGHTDRRGTPAYNQALSLERARSVAQAIIALGFPADRVSAEGRGEREPRGVDGDSLQDRRVEVIVR